LRSKIVRIASGFNSPWFSTPLRDVFNELFYYGLLKPQVKLGGRTLHNRDAKKRGSSPERRTQGWIPLGGNPLLGNTWN
tara:strand:- start:1798 stop:2034 length:237 start_codon:yes stop_codon:yes gene_type:complete